ncbi:hypothetical protein SUGI_0868730 [Cryptomeria japonica]|nr:hypothetical protein SUGI_0868730 [Cryptomeria japonica]
MGWLQKNYKSPVEEVFHIARAPAMIALFSMIPGYLFSILLMDQIGRFKIQLVGFFFMSVFLFALAIPYKTYWHDAKNPNGFLVIYSLTFFFAKFGPNTTTFIVPAELFPTQVWSNCHGISAAAGKAGAIIGLFAFVYAVELKGIGMEGALILLGIAGCLGFLCTFLILETKG